MAAVSRGQERSKVNFCLARSWLTQCDKQHNCSPRARLQTNEDSRWDVLLPRRLKTTNQRDIWDEAGGRTTPHFIPPRLIHVSGSSQKPHLQLVETTQLLPNLRYCALSYCWGKYKQESTTNDNLSARYKEIIYSNMPQTIQDAIQVTLGIGLHHLWVDSVCIVQSHAQQPNGDWNKHVSIMGLIYKHAYCTLVAADAPHADAGFLQDENPWFSPFGIRAIRIPLSAARASWPYATYVIDDLAYDARQFTFETQSPLENRAWALQEHLLSSRRLIFKRSGLQFECNAARVSENLPEFQPIFARFLHTSHLQVAYNGAITCDSTSWYRLVEDFCRRLLSFPSDKLAAFEGIAREIWRQTDRQETFAAGLRCSRLAEDLCWVVVSRQATRNMDFPTWSWASIANGGIQFIRDAHLQGQASRLGQVTTWSLNIIESTFTQPGQPEFSAPYKSLMKLKGLCGHISATQLSDHVVKWGHKGSLRVTFKSVAALDLDLPGAPGVIFWKDPGVQIARTDKPYRWLSVAFDDVRADIYANNPALATEDSTKYHRSQYWALVLELVDEARQTWRRIGLLATETLSTLVGEGSTFHYPQYGEFALV